MFICPRTRGPLSGLYSERAHFTYPTVDGVPILLPDPRSLVDRLQDPGQTFPDLTRLSVPDAVTPHLPPSMLGAPSGLGQWFTQLGEETPEAVVVSFGSRHAPPGPALDLGCGVGVLARRMVASGRMTWAMDIRADAVVTAKRLLTGQMNVALIPTHRQGTRRVKVPFKPILTDLAFCVGDATLPPFAPESFSWVDMGDVLDTYGESAPEAMVEATALVQHGGVLTVATGYGSLGAAGEGSPGPDEELLEAMTALGLVLVDQRDRVPWVSRDYDRSWRIRFSHCMAFRKN